MKSDIISKREGIYKPRIKHLQQKRFKLKLELIRKKYITSIRQPSKILKVSNLPIQSNITMVQMLFQEFPGFQAVSNPNNGECLISFNSEMDSKRAKVGMDGFK